MGRAVSGARSRNVLGYWVDRRWRKRTVGDDHFRLVAIPEDDPVDSGPAQRIWIMLKRHARLHGPPGDRPALWLIAVKERRAAPSLQHACQLPSQVVNISDSAVHPEASVRCSEVRSVARKENTTVAETRG